MGLPCRPLGPVQVCVPLGLGEKVGEMLRVISVHFLEMAPCSSRVGEAGGVGFRGRIPGSREAVPRSTAGRRPKGPEALETLPRRAPRIIPPGSLQLPRRKAPCVKVKYSQLRFLDGITEKLELDF